jgi:hypothetical protein
MASTVGKQWKIVDEAMRAFLVALSRVEPSAPTWSSGWSAHEVTAHVAAAAQERADLIEEHLAGHPARATRTWQEREPPFRALPGRLTRPTPRLTRTSRRAAVPGPPSGGVHC